MAALRSGGSLPGGIPPIFLLDATVFALTQAQATPPYFSVDAWSESRGTPLWTATLATTQPQNLFAGVNHTLCIATWTDGIYALDTTSGHALWHDFSGQWVTAVTAAPST